LLGTVSYESPAQERARTTLEVAGLKLSASNRESARRITQAAAESARGGDCASVIIASLRVRALDEEIHRTTFVVEVAIGWCLAKAGLLENPVPPPVESTQPGRGWAFALTKIAAQAADAGNCDIALQLQHRVRDLDGNVHDAWFVRNERIKRCLEPASTPTPSTAAPLEHP
jgi:hypothetical protein